LDWKTTVALSLEFVRKMMLNLRALIEKLTGKPVPLLTVKKGADADITIVDPEREWTYDVARSAGKSRRRAV